MQEATFELPVVYTARQCACPTEHSALHCQHAPLPLFLGAQLPLDSQSQQGFKALLQSKVASRLPQAHMNGFHPFLSPALVGKDETIDLGVKTLPGTPVSIPCLNFHIHR